MYTKPEPIDIIRILNNLGENPTLDQESELVSIVCKYFDCIKQEYLTQADLKFLQYIARTSGIPQFYEMLAKHQQDTQIIEPNIGTISNYIYDKYLECVDGRKLHKYQKRIYDLFEKGKTNRYFLSASTSFGKTHLLFDIIQKMDYTNVVLIFPTIALLAENLERVYTEPNLASIKSKYTIHTLSDVDTFGEKNLFIFTPERFLSYLEKDTNLVKDFHFVFIDEIYKIDNDYEIDDVQKENERDIAYRLASFYALDPMIDVLLAGPYVNVSNKENDSFNKFLQLNNIKFLDYNAIEIVSKDPIAAYRKINYNDGKLVINSNQRSKKATFITLIQDILAVKENTLVYCYSRSQTEEYAKIILTEQILPVQENTELQLLLDHIGNLYGTEWITYKCLQHGIGLHHGLLPKYIQKETINLFNAGILKVLLCTTTITEGVNTSAKNLIVLNSKKGNKTLKPFDAKNIAGRAGRFMQHYSGRIIVLDREFDNVVKEEEKPIKHKNYDKEQNKTNIELTLVDDEFLNESDKNNKNKIKDAIFDSGIASEIFDKYKMIGALDKIVLFHKIIDLVKNPIKLQQLQNCVNKSMYNILDNDGFEQVLDCIKPIINNQKLGEMANFYGTKNEWQHSLLTICLNHYLKDGFSGLFKYKAEKTGNIDQSMRDTSEFVYNILKYQLVKYLGAFNLLYKYLISLEIDAPIDDIDGFDKLLSKLEYNAYSSKAKIVSDYGCTNNVISYFEDNLSDTERNNIKNKFDPYEKKQFDKITKWMYE